MQNKDLQNAQKPSFAALAVAYACLYVIWGSTYLAIRFNVETSPPFMATALRFLIAGGVLYLYARPRTTVAPTLAMWLAAAKVGFFTFFVAYGAITHAERFVPSGIASLIVALEPLWFILMDWLFFKGPRPSKRIYAAMLLGISGCGLLIVGDPSAVFSLDSNYIAWIGVIMMGGFAWVFGSLLTRGDTLHPDPFFNASMQMLVGGFMLAVAATWSGDWAHIGEVSLKSWLALAHLTFLGSLVTYTAYVWLLRKQPVAPVAAHAFVNPVVAVFLGWLLAGENFGPEMLVGAVLIVASVVLTLRR